MRFNWCEVRLKIGKNLRKLILKVFQVFWYFVQSSYIGSISPRLGLLKSHLTEVKFFTNWYSRPLLLTNWTQHDFQYLQPAYEGRLCFGSCLSVSPSVCVSVCMCVCVSVCLSVCVSVCSGYTFWAPWHRDFIFDFITNFPRKDFFVVPSGMIRIFGIVAGSLESANSSILAPCRLFKEVVGKKSGFYVN